MRPPRQQRLVQRSRVVLLTAEGKGTEAIAGELRVPASWISRWRQRFARDRWPGLQYLPRPGPPARYDRRTERRVLEMLDASPPPVLACWIGVEVAKSYCQMLWTEGNQAT